MLIVLSGASSSGKTRLAKAMQVLADRPLLHLEADQFVPALDSDLVASEDEAFQRRFIVAAHKAVAVLASEGFDVIVDGSLPNDPSLRQDCLQVLSRLTETKVVAVRCSQEELARREVARGDRPTGWATKQALEIHVGQAFNAEVDTTSMSPEIAARELLRQLF